MTEKCDKLYLSFKLRGVTFEGRQGVLRKLRDVFFADIFLEREPDNEYDSKAIRVVVNPEKTDENVQIGYVPRELAQYLARIMDEKGETFKPVFSEIQGHKNIKTLSVKITITIGPYMSAYFRELEKWCPKCWAGDARIIRSQKRGECRKCESKYTLPNYSVSTTHSR